VPAGHLESATSNLQSAPRRHAKFFEIRRLASFQPCRRAAELRFAPACALSELVNGKRGISPEMAVRLSKVFGGSAESWLTQQAHYDLARVHAERIKLKRLESTVGSSS
jgi:addiction module HigA family antidote